MQEVLMIETVPSGTVLHGRYRIERVLGSGGFGHVYLAVDMASNQQFAVKEYLVTGATGQEQLKHEATVLRHLHHPNLPAFLDAFIEHGRYYVVINYIEGSDLTDLIRMARQRNEVIPIAQTLSWLLAICDAVMFLHSQQPIVIHRDIKPDNIRITPGGTAWLVDLGNAKTAADGSRTLFFIRHQGTPGYAPPEQYPGGSGTDARSDIYALGGTLYFALTMHEPPSVSVRNQSIQQGNPNLPTLQDHLANNPPLETPEEIAARQFRLGVTKPGKPAPRHLYHVAQLGTLPLPVLNRLNAIIHRAMALKPRDRYQYVADLANDLKQVLKALPQPPTPPSSRPGADPHSTQPDLPGLYDALMEAKEQQGKGPVGSQFSFPDAPTDCARCGNQLAPQATFCPTCGTPVASKPANSQPDTAGAAQKDVSAEQTLLITQKQLHQARAQAVASLPQPSVPAPEAVRSSSPPPAYTAEQQQNQSAFPPMSSQVQVQVQTVRPLAPPRAQNNYAATSSANSASAGNFTWNVRLLLMLLVILVLVIIAIVLVVLIQQKQQASSFSLPLATLAPLQTMLSSLRVLAC
jgi:serine/threonine protein kinase